MAPDFAAWEDAVTANPSYSACPDPPAASKCVVGTYLMSQSNGCNSCYGDGDKFGPNCNSTTTLSCTAYSCYCMPRYASDPYVLD